MSNRYILESKKKKKDFNFTNSKSIRYETRTVSTVGGSRIRVRGEKMLDVLLVWQHKELGQ